MAKTSALMQLGRELKDLDSPLAMTIHPISEDSTFSTGLLEVAHVIARAAGDGIVLRKGDGDGLPGAPALTLHHPGSGPIHYLALPDGHEAAPFWEAMTRRTQSVNLSGDIEGRLRALAQPAELLVFIASLCPHCPEAARAANALALCSPQITTAVIDAEHFPDLAKRFKVQSVPMIVLDGELLIDEVVPAKELAQHVLARGTDSYERAVFLSQVKTGNTDRATKHLLKGTRSAGSFLSAWTDSTFHVRLALMLVAEDALAENPAILNPIVAELIDLLGTKDDALRGDTADLLGRIGHPDAREPLQTLLRDPNADIVEIAEEALGDLSD
ncbi:MAG: hypothetical protein GXP25_00985 [Planctomycetes bacterium]|nr:hypothetical protein [Planctomycetota bacterium]